MCVSRQYDLVCRADDVEHGCAVLSEVLVSTKRERMSRQRGTLKRNQRRDRRTLQRFSKLIDIARRPDTDARFLVRQTPHLAQNAAAHKFPLQRFGMREIRLQNEAAIKAVPSGREELGSF